MKGAHLVLFSTKVERAVICDESKELLTHYSGRAQACNNFKLYDGKTAEADFKGMEDAVKENDLLRHNLVVFRNGEGALQVKFLTVEDLCKSLAVCCKRVAVLELVL